MEFKKNIIGYDLKNKWFLKLEYIELSDSLDDKELNKLMKDKTKLYYNLDKADGFEMTKGKAYIALDFSIEKNKYSYITITDDDGGGMVLHTSYFSVKEIGKHKYHLIKNKIFISDKLRFNEYGEFSVPLKD